MKLAVISRHDSSNTLDLLSAAKRHGVTCKVFPLKELALDTAHLDDHEFFSYDVYLFRGYNKNYALARTLAQSLIKRGKIVIDKNLAGSFTPSKFQEAIMYQDNHISHIRTYQAQSAAAWQSLDAHVSYPMIVKDVDSQRGKGVRLCQNEAELLEEIESFGSDILIQDFIKMSFDIRVLCIGDKAIGAIKRESAGEDFRTNVSLGGHAAAYKLTDDEAALALSAHQTMGYDISGVDMAYDDTGTLRIIETNISPEWQGYKEATGQDVADTIIKYMMEL